MHVLAVPLFRDATGVAVTLTAWARHRCLQLYLLLLLLGTEHRWCEDPIESALFIRAQASKAQGPLVLLRIIIRAQASKAQGPLVFLRIIIIIIYFFSRFWGVLGPLTYTKTLENSHTRWNPRPSGRRRGWDPGVAQGLYGAPWNTV